MSIGGFAEDAPNVKYKKKLCKSFSVNQEFLGTFKNLFQLNAIVGENSDDGFLENCTYSVVGEETLEKIEEECAAWKKEPFADTSADAIDFFKKTVDTLNALVKDILETTNFDEEIICFYLWY